jgi:hypothetical protein
MGTLFLPQVISVFKAHDLTPWSKGISHDLLSSLKNQNIPQILEL